MKVIAEHTAWDLIGFEGGDWELNQLGHDLDFGRETPALVRIKGGRALYENSVFLRDVTEGPLVLSGTEVGRDGGQSGTLKVSKRTHVIDKALVSKRVPCYLDLHYGLLVEVASDDD